LQVCFQGTSLHYISNMERMSPLYSDIIVHRQTLF
jgi:hypothetical protein